MHSPVFCGFKPKFIMFKFVVAVSLILLSISGQAQFAVTGKITDSRTHRALTGVAVSIDDGKKVTVTDDLGFFRFEKVAPGTHHITATLLGFSPSRQELEVNANASIALSMDEAAILTDEVVVTATRANEKTPTTYSTVSREAIQKQNFGQDLPILLNWTPSVVTTSDAGTGVGYTGIRIRGSDPTRVNVTINGIPYNDSESLGTFWVDVPDIASSTQSVQIQRGVGTSTNGAGAFGATVNLQTNRRNDQPYAEIMNSYGSFNTHKHTISFGTGLLNDGWTIDGRISKIASDGFIDRASSDLQSYYFAAGYYGKNTMLKAIVFGGRERTYQSWWGVPQSRLNNDPEAMLATAANEGWNNIQTANLLNSNSRTFNSYLYPNQVDDYRQDHYQLHFSQTLAAGVTFNSALHLTPGKGYYEEYRYDDALENYGLSPLVIGDSTVESTDLVRRRWLDNKFYGATYSLNVEKQKYALVVGGAWTRYVGDHFGEITWAQVSAAPADYRYYFNQGDKRDFNMYAKLNYDVSDKLNLFVDLQNRWLTYSASGLENKLVNFNVDKAYSFFNPKFGLTYQVKESLQAYASLAIANREPVRDDFVDNPGSTPKPENLRNLEVGIRNSGTAHSLNVNYYLMDYRDQLVLTGQLNDVGASVRTNVNKSYRMGIEIDGLVKLHRKWQWNANLTLSRNKIASFTEVLYDYGENFDEYNVVTKAYKNTDISFSPNVIAGSSLSWFPFSQGEVTLLTKYVGKQYLDNTSNEQRSIASYMTNDMRLSYHWKLQSIRQVVVSLLVNNILDTKYESNGYTWGYLGGSVAYRENYYFPQAGRNVMAMLTLKF